METKITLTGDLGSGKSTVADVIVKRTGAEYCSTGVICRRVAESHGFDVLEMNRYMETHPELDHEIDEGMAALSDVDKRMIIDSRMAWHFVRNSFRVYLSCDLRSSGERIMRDGRATEKYSSVEEAMEKIAGRKASEKKRYLALYGADYTDLSNYSLVLDTTDASPTEVADVLLSVLADWEQASFTETRAYICPTRLLYPAEGAPLDEVHELSCRIDLNEEIPPVEIFEKDGSFYVKSGVASALAYALADCVFVPARLVDGVPEGEYVSMKNNL